MATKHPGKRKKVAIFSGGPSPEHEVSLKSGKNVLKHLNPEKYEGFEFVVSKTGEWPLAEETLRAQADLAFIAMHGPYGEDGTVQHLLETMSLPHTGSSAAASALGMNKFISLRHLADHGLTVPRTLLFHRIEWLRDRAAVLQKVQWYLEKPWVVKPNRGGSSIGVKMAGTPDELFHALEEGFEETPDIIVQPFIAGREYTCAVLDSGISGAAFSLPPTEIVPQGRSFFDYEAKYTPGASLEITPARAPQSYITAFQRTALFAHNVLGCRGFSRTDMILGRDHKLYVLEVNTIPGLTENSLLPKAAASYGLSMQDVLDVVIEAALR
ncbi:D-alanine--D-alanine ligase [Patescibacteria group bacterium]|nr:D-alanine--D-alanine ligase [Patescibacteria group bacterium]